MNFKTLNAAVVVSTSAATLTLLSACASAPDSAAPMPGAAVQAAHTERCVAVDKTQIAALFDRWNASLQTGDPHRVAANYASDSILLPTLSNTPRLSVAEKEDYFHHFLENKPSGRIDSRHIETACNTAVDAGLYTFTLAASGSQVRARYTFTYRWDGAQWLITSHHSSVMPEKT